ncbi:glycosyltransferase family 2 protein [Pelomonas sp. V22]|uniref:glycosyltransferase family 2 protein n=1 Tax=Pelomonas sp. V22 TaxID=2822139 RepID=UPI0024A856B0|nr:glycosyltransferase family 2 protein [Pelomonas sp. V22]MDI4633790.1 glycosyltransferase family 2 protein [Pelomonas sp. V22]
MQSAGTGGQGSRHRCDTNALKMVATLCLVVIARDEAAHIERLLRSVAPFVDRMLVLDTGSVDATPALAAACGAQVEHFTWVNDFSAARNRALELANADWHLVLDADEWLIDGGEVLRGLRQQTPDFVGSLALEDQFFDGELRHSQGRLSRVLPGAVRYAGSIHEQPQHELPVRNLAIRVGHDGYLPERLAAKRGRNRVLLEQALATAPDDAYLSYQLGKDADVYEAYEAAEAAFARAAKQPDVEAHDWWPDLMVRRLFALKKLKRHEQAMNLAELQLQRCGESPDFFFVLGDLLLDCAAEAPEQASGLVPMIEQAWLRCLELGERPDLPGAVAGRGSRLAAHNLALLLEGTGRAVEAQQLRADFGLASPSKV